MGRWRPCPRSEHGLSPLGATEADPEDRTSLCGCFDPWPWPAQTPGGPWVMDICREPRSLPLLARSQPGLWATLAVVAPLALLLIPITGVSRAAPRVGGPMSNPVSRVDAGAASLCSSGAGGAPLEKQDAPVCPDNLVSTGSPPWCEPADPRVGRQAWWVLAPEPQGAMWLLCPHTWVPEGPGSWPEMDRMPGPQFQPWARPPAWAWEYRSPASPGKDTVHRLVAL